MASYNNIEQKLFAAISSVKGAWQLDDFERLEMAKACVAVLVSAKLAPEDGILALHKAEQQLTGFYFHDSGGRLMELIESMGLTCDEWSLLQVGFNIQAYMPVSDINEVDNYLKNKPI